MWSDLFVLLELFIINFHFVKNCQIHFSCTIDFSKRHMNLCVLKINKILLCLEKEKQSLCSIFCLAVMDLTLKYVKLKSIVLNKIKMGMFHVLWWRKAGLVREHSQVAHPLTGESTHWSWHANEPFTAFCSNVNIQFRKIWWW